ncbi:hypothetical protein A2V61_00215 [Candidatus Woesebacteria bacterium RBG_19FT_COMBO_47_8]|nr:MAG: hypothetical protein A2V61_00215 [Candidatus Woesebacteria bacterium RBG_19FT_COMBO_47_8]
MEAGNRFARQVPHNTINVSLANIKIYLASLKEKWVFALSIVLTPGAVAPALIAIALFLYAQSLEGTTRIALEIFEIIFSSVTTAVIVQNLIEAKGNTILSKKSVTSIRYLQSLKYKVKNISDRIKIFNEKDDRNLDEIQNLISNVDKDILNSITDWADINPASVEIVDYFEEMRLKEDSINTLNGELKSLKTQKDQLAKDKTEEIEDLEKEILKKESDISKLQNKVSEQSLSNLSIASGTFPTGPSGPTLSAYIVNPCKRCGKPLSLSDGYDSNPLTQGLCMECKRNV